MAASRRLHPLPARSRGPHGIRAGASPADGDKTGRLERLGPEPMAEGVAIQFLAAGGRESATVVERRERVVERA